MNTRAPLLSALMSILRSAGPVDLHPPVTQVRGRLRDAPRTGGRGWLEVERATRGQRRPPHAPLREQLRSPSPEGTLELRHERERLGRQHVRIVGGHRPDDLDPVRHHVPPPSIDEWSSVPGPNRASAATMRIRDGGCPDAATVGVTGCPSERRRPWTRRTRPMLPRPMTSPEPSRRSCRHSRVSSDSRAPTLRPIGRPGHPGSMSRCRSWGWVVTRSSRGSPTPSSPTACASVTPASPAG